MVAGRLRMLAGNRGRFHPLHLTRSVLTAWWAAEDLTSGSVTNWTDRIGGLVMTQATGAQRPTQAATSFNGAYPGVSFDGAMTNLGLTSLGNIPIGSTAGEIWCVATNTSIVSTIAIPAVVGTGVAASRRLQAGTSGNLGVAGVNDGTGSDTSATPWTSPLIVKGDWSGTAMNCFVNGVPAAGNPMTIGSLNTNNTRARIGASSAVNPANFWPGPIADVLILTSVLSTALRQKTEGYFAWKYALQSQLPTTHPYKLFQP